MYLTTIVCTGISFFTRFCYFFFGGLMTMRQIGFPIAENFSSYSVMTFPSRILAMMQVKRIVDHLPTGKFYLFQ